MPTPKNWVKYSRIRGSSIRSVTVDGSNREIKFGCLYTPVFSALYWLDKILYFLHNFCSTCSYNFGEIEEECDGVHDIKLDPFKYISRRSCFQYSSEPMLLLRLHMNTDCFALRAKWGNRRRILNDVRKNDGILSEFTTKEFNSRTEYSCLEAQAPWKPLPMLPKQQRYVQ